MTIKQLIAICLVGVMSITSTPITTYAETPGYVSGGNTQIIKGTTAGVVTKFGGDPSWAVGTGYVISPLLGHSWLRDYFKFSDDPSEDEKYRTMFAADLSSLKSGEEGENFQMLAEVFSNNMPIGTAFSTGGKILVYEGDPNYLSGYYGGTNQLIANPNTQAKIDKLKNGAAYAELNSRGGLSGWIHASGESSQYTIPYSSIFHTKARLHGTPDNPDLIVDNIKTVLTPRMKNLIEVWMDADRSRGVEGEEEDLRRLAMIKLWSGTYNLGLGIELNEAVRGEMASNKDYVYRASQWVQELLLQENFMQALQAKCDDLQKGRTSGKLESEEAGYSEADLNKDIDAFVSWMTPFLIFGLASGGVIPKDSQEQTGLETWLVCLTLGLINLGGIDRYNESLRLMGEGVPGLGEMAISMSGMTITAATLFKGWRSSDKESIAFVATANVIDSVYGLGNGNAFTHTSQNKVTKNTRDLRDTLGELDVTKVGWEKWKNVFKGKGGTLTTRILQKFNNNVKSIPGDVPSTGMLNYWRYVMPSSNPGGDKRVIDVARGGEPTRIKTKLTGTDIPAKTFDKIWIGSATDPNFSCVSGLQAIIMSGPLMTDLPGDEPSPEVVQITIPVGFFKWSMYINDADVNGDTIEVDHNKRTQTIKHKIAYRTQKLHLWEEFVNGRPVREPLESETGFTKMKDDATKLPAVKSGMLFDKEIKTRLWMRIERIPTNSSTSGYESFGTAPPTNVNVPGDYVTKHASQSNKHDLIGGNTYMLTLDTPAKVLALFAEGNPDPNKSTNSASMLNPAVWVHDVTAKMEDNWMLNTVLGNPDKNATGVWRQNFHYTSKTTMRFSGRGSMSPPLTEEKMMKGEYPTYLYWEDGGSSENTHSEMLLCFPYENVRNAAGGHVLEPHKSVTFLRKGGTPKEGIHRYTDVQGWSEVKEGVPKGEIWEAMAGVPTTEKLYYAVGGNTFAVEMIVKEEEVVMPRTYRNYNWSNPTSHCQHNYDVLCGNNGEGFNCHGKTGHGTCGAPIPGDPPSSCSTSHPAPLHSTCNTHINPGYRASWRGFFDNGRYVKIEALNVWKLEKGWVEGMEKLLVTTNKDGSGNELKTGHEYITEMEVNSYNVPQPSLFWNIPQSDTSAEGRIYYSFEPQMFDNVVYLGLEDTQCQSQCSKHRSQPYSFNTEFQGNRNEIDDFKAMQTAKTDITVLSDTAILRTPTGDIALLYYENQGLKNIPVAFKHNIQEEATGHWSYDYGWHMDCPKNDWYYPAGMESTKATSRGGGLVERPKELYTFPDKTMAEMWVGNRWSMHNVALESKSYIDTGSYNGNVLETTITNQEPKWTDKSPTNNINLDTQTLFGKGQQIGTTISTPIMKARVEKTGPGWCTDAPGSCLESGLINRLDKVGIPTSTVYNRQTKTNQTYTATYGRHYEPKPDPEYIMFHDAYEIHIRKNNGVYQMGKSYGMWRAILNYEGVKAKYSVAPDTKHFANMIGFEREIPINDIIIYNPVSTEYSFVYTLPDERDQRLTDSSKVVPSYQDFDHYKSEYRPTDDYPVIKVGGKTYKQATFLNLDWGAQWYFPNYGDFDGNLSRRYGLTQLTDVPGQNYVNQMDFSTWLQRKWVNANFDFIFEGVGYKAGEDCEIFNRGRDYYRVSDDYGYLYKENFRMYIPLENFEMNNGVFSMYATDINDYNPYTVLNPLDQNRTYIGDRRARAAFHGAVKHWPLDLVGRVGNLTAEHVTDQYFAPTFKQADNPVQWIINNLIPKINLNKPFRYYGVLTDVRNIPLEGQETIYPINDGEGGREADNYNRNTDTYGNMNNRADIGKPEGAESWPITFPIAAAKNIWSLRDKVFPSVLRSDEMKIGSEVFLDVTTLGNYGETGNLQIKPHWYFVDFDSGKWTPVDIYNYAGGKYELIYRFGLAELSSFEHDFDQYITKPIYNIDWVEEQAPRNQDTDDINDISEGMQGDLETWLAYLRGENGTDVLLKDLQDGVYGRENPVGTVQLIMLEPRYSRTWIGRTKTLGQDTNPYGVFDPTKYYKQGTLWNWKLGLPSTAYPVVSETNEDWDTKTIPPTKEQIAELAEKDGMLVCTAEIIAIGDVWDLLYEPTETTATFKVWNDDGPDNKKEQKTSEEFIPEDTREYPPDVQEPLVNTPGQWESIIVPTHVVDPNGSGNVFNPQEEHIIMTYEINKRVTDAFEAVGTH